MSLIDTRVTRVTRVTTDASVTSDAKLPHMPSSLHWGGWRRDEPTDGYGK
jgi:hypothetical protein